MTDKMFLLIFIIVFMINIPILYVGVFDANEVTFTIQYKEGVVDGYDQHNITKYHECMNTIRDRGMFETVRNNERYCYSKGYVVGFDNYYNGM